MSDNDTGKLVRVMVDIETLGTGNNAVILSIGATTIPMEHCFYTEVDINSQVGRTIDTSTLNWWLDQERNKNVRIPNAGVNTLSTSLMQFFDYIKSVSINAAGLEIWCKGTDFDVTILSLAYESLALPIPWKYNDTRDCRTLFKVADSLGVIYTKRSSSHDALQDAINQAEMVDEIFNYLHQCMDTIGDETDHNTAELKFSSSVENNDIGGGA